jgi:hypothetical protein
MRIMIRAAARRLPAVSGTIDVKRQRCSSIRPAIDGTRISARALFAAAATTPQNLTSGRRSWRPHQNSSYSRSLSSIGRNQSLWRHLAARTLCGPPAEFSRGLEFPRAKAGCCTLRAASGRLHRSSLWDFALGHTAPKRDQKLSGQRHYRDQANSIMMWRRRGLPAFEIPCSRSIEPLRHGVGARRRRRPRHADWRSFYRGPRCREPRRSADRSP